jgi:hypothetical protein
MYGEIPYKYRYMLNKIINCIIEYIMKNLRNSLIVESKLLLINNYIIEIFTSHDILGKNSSILTKINSTNSLDKTSPNNKISLKYDKNASFSKLNNIVLSLSDKNTIENTNQNHNEQNIIKILPYKDKYKIIKLKKLLKNEQEKSAIKELSYLKRLSFFQEKLNFYESKNLSPDKSKNNNDIDNNNISLKFDEDKIKSKLNINNNVDYWTIINSCKTKRSSEIKKLFFRNTKRMMRHSMSHQKLFDKDNKNIF